MPKTRDQKKVIVKDLVDKFSRAKSIVFFNFDNLPVSDIEKLRKQCRTQGIDYVVAKKTLLNVAFKDTAIDIDARKIDRGIATVIDYQDEVTPAKVVETFAKDHPALKTIGGVYEKKFVGAEKIKALSLLPSKLELLGQLVRTIKAPISGFVNVLAGNLRGLVQVLKAISEKK